MDACYKLRKGLDIPLRGEALTMTYPSISSPLYELKPTDFRQLIPKLLVREGDPVMAGSPVFCDKDHPEILFTSPISGTVKQIVRGEKRKLTGIRIVPDGRNDRVRFPVTSPEELDEDKIRELLLQSGCWPLITRRPYGTLALPGETPKAIHISCFDTAPLAPQYDYAFAGEYDSLQMGLRVLDRLCPGKVHLVLSSKTSIHSVFRRLNATFHTFAGPHPAGNPGIQIHHLYPLGKGHVVWTLTPMGLSVIGRLFTDGTFDTSRMVAVTGPALIKTGYIKCPAGIQISALKDFTRKKDVNIRVVSGNPLTGDTIGEEGFLGFHHQQVTFLQERSSRELLGWARPLRLKKFSAARTYISYLVPLLGKTGRFNLDTNLNGGVRAFVMAGDYQKVLPMDLFVSLLIKAILASDIDKMEKLGIYEVIPEDLALCEFICPSKIEIQDILQKGIDLMIKEMQ